MVAPDYDRPNRMGLIPGHGYTQSVPNYFGQDGIMPQTMEMNSENRQGAYMDEVRRRSAAPRRLKKGGPVRMDGCAVRGKTKGRLT